MNVANAEFEFVVSAFWGQSFVKELKMKRIEPERWLKLGIEPEPIRIDWRSYDGESESLG